MKKFWKALGIAALAAAVPVRFKKDEETGKKTYQSLLLSVDVGPGEEEGTEIGVNVGEGVLTQAIGSLVNAKKESKLFTDDPEEAVPFAGEAEPAEPAEAAAEPEAAVEEAKADESEAAAGEEAKADDAGEKKDGSDEYFL